MFCCCWKVSGNLLWLQFGRLVIWRKRKGQGRKELLVCRFHSFPHLKRLRQLRGLFFLRVVYQSTLISTHNKMKTTMQRHNLCLRLLLVALTLTLEFNTAHGSCGYTGCSNKPLFHCSLHECTSYSDMYVQE